MAEFVIPSRKTFRNLIGLKFGRLEVKSYHGLNVRRQPMWLCDCECGASKEIIGRCLLDGRTQSCGCLQKERCLLKNTTHGATVAGKRLPEYDVWIAMNQRCTNERHPEFVNYGQRGITVCERWRHSFQNFIDDMGRRPSKAHSLDRFPNNDGNYEKENCRWATDKEQCRNMRTNCLVTWNGETLCLAEWSEKTGIHVNTLWLRLKLGQTGDRLFRPIDPRFSSRYWTR